MIHSKKEDNAVVVDGMVLEGDAGAGEEYAEFSKTHQPKLFNFYGNAADWKPNQMPGGSGYGMPRTMTFMGILFVVLCWGAMHNAADMATNVKMAFAAVIGGFLVFATTQFPDSYFRRPHPYLWRFIMGLGVVQLMWSIFLMFMNLDDARKLMGMIDPKLGVPLPEKSYAEDCRIFTPENKSSMFANLKDAIFDIFFIAHAGGWYVKCLAYRDPIMAFLVSFIFEFLEISLRHVMNNFYECWWDSIILDLLICNSGGIVLGYFTLKFLEMKEYNWIGIREAKGARNKIVRLIGQFTPESWQKFNWGIFSSFKRFAQLFFIIAINEIAEVNCFSLKYLMWVPPNHPLVIGRLAINIALMMPALREYYTFIVDPNVHFIGVNCWIFILNTLVELVTSLRWFSHVEIPPTPTAITVGWTIFTIGLVAFCAIYFPYRQLRRTKANKEKAAC